jgi:hypothetical protein
MIIITEALLPEVVQLTVGAILGAALSINLSRANLSLTDPQTRWRAAGIIVMFVGTFLLLADLLVN